MLLLAAFVHGGNTKKGAGLKRIFALLIVASILVFGACSKEKKEKKEEASTAQTTPPAEHRGTASEMIPDKALTEFEQIINGHIRPFFDPAGTVTEKSVAPGENFDLYVLADVNELYPIAGVEYKLILPAGVSILATTNNDSTVVSLGQYDRDFMIAFRCLDGPRIVVVRYQCKAGDDFVGGTITTMRGDTSGLIGFALCDETRTAVRVLGGTAEIHKKAAGGS
jgi:hypothetical protein